MNWIKCGNHLYNLSLVTRIDRQADFYLLHFADGTKDAIKDTSPFEEALTRLNVPLPDEPRRPTGGIKIIDKQQ